MRLFLITFAGLLLLALNVFQMRGADATNSRSGPDDAAVASTERIVLEARLYWHYEIMGKLAEVTNRNGRIEGTYYERMKPTYFKLDAAKLEDPVAHAEGCKSAMAKIISYLAPGVVPDIPDNRKYMAELLARLKEITGMQLEGYEAWNDWFAKNRSKLKWSKEKKMLVAEGQ